MNTTLKIVIISAIPILFAKVAFGLADTNQSTDPSAYSVIALKNCEIVSKKPMTAAQLNAFVNLKQQEQKMHALELPIKKIEKDMTDYTDKMEKLNHLAIQETDESLHINKQLLAKHEVVAKEFNNFMKKHQQDFDALHKQGRIIGQQAEIFETSIQASLENIDFDQVQILTPNSQEYVQGCDSRIKISVM